MASYISLWPSKGPLAVNWYPSRNASLVKCFFINSSLFFPASSLGTTRISPWRMASLTKMAERLSRILSYSEKIVWRVSVLMDTEGWLLYFTKHRTRWYTSSNAWLAPWPMCCFNVRMYETVMDNNYYRSCRMSCIPEENDATFVPSHQFRPIIQSILSNSVRRWYFFQY